MPPILASCLYNTDMALLKVTAKGHKANFVSYCHNSRLDLAVEVYLACWKQKEISRLKRKILSHNLVIISLRSGSGKTD